MCVCSICNLFWELLAISAVLWTHVHSLWIIFSLSFRNKINQLTGRRYWISRAHLAVHQNYGRGISIQRWDLQYRKGAGFSCIRGMAWTQNGKYLTLNKCHTILHGNLTFKPCIPRTVPRSATTPACSFV